ncbi:MAG TPA: heme-binding domain-containing protein [Gemmatimonadaceae bacterium]
MHTSLKPASVILLSVVVAFAVAQSIRPARANPPTDPGRTIAAHPGASSQLVSVLGRACGDCHSNAIERRWYTRTPPVSWIMARAASEGRRAVNFSEWGSYSTDQQRMLLAASCQDSRSGKMPVSIYVTLHPEARLSPQDVETICAVAKLTEASTRRTPQ